MSTETVIVSETPIDGFESEVLGDDENIFAPDDDEEETEQNGEDDEDVDEDDDDASDDDDENIFEEEDDDDDEDDEDEEEEDDDDSPEPPRLASAQTQADAAAAMLAAKGIDYNSLVDEFQNGGLSEKSIKALADAGFSKDVIDSYVSGQQAKYDLYARDVQSLAGGEKGYEKLCRWAMKHLSVEEQREFDRAVESMDMGRAKFAVHALMARKQMATGKSPELVKAKATKHSGGAKPFSNIDDISKALDDKRYGSDPKYTKMVDARLMATPY